MIPIVKQVRGKLQSLRKRGMSRKDAAAAAKDWARQEYGLDPAILALVMQLIQLLLPLIFKD